MTISSIDFDNISNNLLYSKNDISFIDEAVTTAGLSTNLDLHNIRDLFSENDKILEIGSGSGRVLNYLYHLRLNLKIYGFEICEQYYTKLKQKFFRISNVHVDNKNVLTSALKRKYTISLCLFSIFAEFNPGEQNNLLKKLTQLTEKYIIIDLPHPKSKVNGHHISDNFFILSSPKADMKTYVPQTEGILAYLERTGFFLKEVREYQTDTARDRVQYILEKKH